MDKLVFDENMERLNRVYLKKEHRKKLLKLLGVIEFRSKKHIILLCYHKNFINLFSSSINSILCYHKNIIN